MPQGKNQGLHSGIAAHSIPATMGVAVESSSVRRLVWISRDVGSRSLRRVPIWQGQRGTIIALLPWGWRLD